MNHIGGLDEVLGAYKVESAYALQVSHTTQAYEDFLLPPIELKNQFWTFLIK
jgi:beta-lactamase superfamily II metal-dependent hydrolase